MPPSDNTTNVQDSDIDALVPPIIRQALAAYRRDLEQLLRERPGQWVAYHGDRRLGFARTITQLYEECQRQGYAPEQFLVRCIEPEPVFDYLGQFEPG